MYFDTKSIGGTIEILASNDYQAVPLALTESAKAGMPITAAGAKAATGESAIGILLYDVDIDRNPNAAIVVDGIIDWAKCQKNNNEELTGTDADKISKALPNIAFRDAEGKTHVGGGTAAE